MRESRAVRRVMGGAIALAMAVVPAASGAQEEQWTVPRTPDGRPDLQGVWANNTATPLERPEILGDKATLTDEELARLDKWVRNNTVDRFGPVREVEKRLVFEVAFDSIHTSPRHKSGLAMRFPRIARIRWDKPAAEADRIEALEAMV